MRFTTEIKDKACMEVVSGAFIKDPGSSGTSPHDESPSPCKADESGSLVAIAVKWPKYGPRHAFRRVSMPLYAGNFMFEGKRCMDSSFHRTASLQDCGAARYVARMGIHLDAMLHGNRRGLTPVVQASGSLLALPPCCVARPSSHKALTPLLMAAVTSAIPRNARLDRIHP